MSYKRYVTIALSLAALYGGFKGCTLINKSNSAFKMQEAVIKEDISRSSPFTNLITITPEKKKVRKEWYHGHTHVKLNSNDIIYHEGLGLYKGRTENQRQREKIADTVVKHGCLFAVDTKVKGQPDVYWINSDNNLRRLKNVKSRFIDDGFVLSLNKYFYRIPDNVVVCDINADGYPDLLYAGTVDVDGVKRNAIKASVCEGNKFVHKGAFVYLGVSELDKIVAKDLDYDGDSDLVFNLRDSNTLYGLENITVKGSNFIDFKNGFIEKVNSDDTDMLNFLIQFIGAQYVIFNR